MSFMDAQITEKQYWLIVDTRQGTLNLPADLLGEKGSIKALALWNESQADREAADDETDAQHDAAQIAHAYIRLTALDELWALIGNYVEASEAEDIEDVRSDYAYGVRASAAGYMDCTEWEVFGNLREAEKRAREVQRECEGKD